MGTRAFLTQAEWSVFCDTYVNGTKDPARHTAETLQTFLDKYGGAQAAAQSVAGYGMWQPAAASKTRPGPSSCCQFVFRSNLRIDEISRNPVVHTSSDAQFLRETSHSDMIRT